MRYALWTVAIVVTMWPATAGAQIVDARYRIGLSGGVQTSGSGIGETFTMTRNVEAATIGAVAPFDRATLVDVGGWARIAGRLGAGAAFSRISRRSNAAIDGKIPHPFYYDQQRSITGTQPGVDEHEDALHVDVVVLAAVSPAFELAVFAGPTWFHTSQDLVTNVSYTESYPFDTATFSSATLVRATSSKAGVNAGADLTWFFSEHVGVGGLVRFSRATTAYSAGEDRSATARIGGTQAAVGLRVSF
jgi:hypothetical protein